MSFLFEPCVAILPGCAFLECPSGNWHKPTHTAHVPLQITSQSYTPTEHDHAHLVFGDYLELLARVADEYFKGSKVLKSLASKLGAVIRHVYKTTTEKGNLPELKEPSVDKSSTGKKSK